MDKRYQVFVSSTYADLKDERQQVLQALMELDCIPAGMELFPAADEEQWEFIKKVIDDCDYYLLIIGGRYGSVTSEGISYTEKEFDYALKIGLKVIALVHGSPEEIPLGKSEQNSDLRERLLQFKSKVMDGRLIKYWTTAKELPGLVALSLTRTIKTYPAIGWVRTNNVSSEEILLEINALRKNNAELQARLLKAEDQLKPAIEGIADLDSSWVVSGTYQLSSEHLISFDCKTTWRKIFALISPYLIECPNDMRVKSIIAASLKREATGNNLGWPIAIHDQDFKTISVQLMAYGLVETRYTQTTEGGMSVFWSLTPKGYQVMLESRVVKDNSAP